MTHHVDPTGETFALFKALPRDEPVHMLNLVKLRTAAVYPDGRTATGAQAYAEYGAQSGPVFRKLGGMILWSGSPKLMLIGPPEETWDKAFVAAYPSAQAFIDMLRDPAYRAAVIHRQAAVETSRLIRMAPGRPGEGFG